MKRKLHDYQGGEIYAFRTSPATEFSPKETGRYAAFKVLGRASGKVYYAVLDGVFDRHPELAQVLALPYLIRTRFFFRGDVACCSSPLDWSNELEDLRFVGSVKQTEEDAKLLFECRSMGSWTGVSSDAEGEWRWRNDRAAYTDEVQRSQRERDARLAAERERYERRLKTLTWGKLLEETQLPRWNKHPPFPPPAFVAAARARIRGAILELQALGPKPNKAQARAVLKSCVEWFNATNAQFDEVIETEEREDICTVLLELAVVAGHRSLAVEADGWHLW